ncbi:hypothetical protein PR202_gb03511 [Eleusine coracana subsp. coracana]|uniref:Protein kinase domain-containing protein n=1 Tax=Eleusine coracana subsp. coracana TaxID=191504 RepID=A0AAV5E214_ELECO|nr:hypothetical protein PR202_gb03511 [Eleusine coracana subsp. coracana]
MGRVCSPQSCGPKIFKLGKMILNRYHNHLCLVFESLDMNLRQALKRHTVGCCLYELYTGETLFPGPSNNDMLRRHMELKGPFPKKMLRKGAFTAQHFKRDMNFEATEDDPVTRKVSRRLILNTKPKGIGSKVSNLHSEDPKLLSSFKDLLDKIFFLDPEKRITVEQALSHPFITGKVK